MGNKTRRVRRTGLFRNDRGNFHVSLRMLYRGLRDATQGEGGNRPEERVWPGHRDPLNNHVFGLLLPTRSKALLEIADNLAVPNHSATPIARIP